MEFPFDLNLLFPERISVLDQNLCAVRNPYRRSDAQNQTASVIDELGKASAKAQQLPAPITSGAKLQANRHYLYLLKDGERNGGRGVAVGYLKVGYKKLFLLDQRGAHMETEPLCVLDFYVTESLQRHGYGLELFHFMLEHKKVEPEQMAYDRPSPKFQAFLEKHFDLKHTVPQVNNFVVFNGFFTNRSVVPLRKAPPKRPEGEIKPYSLMEREVVREEQRALPWPFVRNAAAPPTPPPGASSPFSRSLSVGSSPSRTPHPPRIPAIQLTENCRAKRTSAQGLVARNNLYSRHLCSNSSGLLMAEHVKLPAHGTGVHLYRLCQVPGPRSSSRIPLRRKKTSRTTRRATGRLTKSRGPERADVPRTQTGMAGPGRWGSDGARPSGSVRSMNIAARGRGDARTLRPAGGR